MSRSIWAEIERRVDSHEYMTGVERTVERLAATAEVFTPTGLVIKMLRDCPKDMFGPGRTVLDPACGDGQFLVAVKWAKVLLHGMAEAEALDEIYGVDIMRDNVDMCKRRLGGGHILMGDTLRPSRRLDQQTDEEYALMCALSPHTARTHRNKR